MIFVLAVRQSVLIDPDLWWHLKTGELIINTHQVPYTDDFSFTKNGSSWVAHEWLSEVLIYSVFRLLGLTGLVILFSLIITFVFWTIYQRCAGRPYAACIAVLLAGAASSPLFGIRPQMITLLLATLYVWSLEGFIEDGNGRRLTWFVPVMILWVNIHAGFALGLALMGLYLIGAALDGRWRRLRPLALASIACVAVVPLNPNGFRMFTYPYETLTSSSMASFIQEWASPDFHKLTYLPLAALLLSTFAALTLGPRSVRLGQLFLLLVTAFAALRSVRHIPIFTLFAAPMFSTQLWAILRVHNWDTLFSGQESRPNLVKLVINGLLLVAPVLLAISRVWDFSANEKFYESIRNPIAAVDFIHVHHVPGTIYNQYGWGGYLIYRLYPDYRVYIDGRADVYGDQFFAETMKVYDGIEPWRQTFDKYQVNSVLISPDAALATLLRYQNDWKVLYEDKDSIVFVKTVL